MGQSPVSRERRHEAAVITSASNRLRRDRGKPRRDDHASGLFVIETKDEEGRWSARSTHRTVRAAEASAWALLTRVGGEVRVRQGSRIVANGTGYTSDGTPPTTSG